MTMNYHMAYIQYALTTFISFNRLSVLLNFNFFEPVSHESESEHFPIQIWRKYTWLLIIFVYFAPFLNTHHVFKYNAIVSYSNVTD